VQGKRKCYRAASDVKILRDSPKKNAVRKNTNARFAKKESKCRDGHDRPTVEGATVRIRQLGFFVPEK